MDSNIFVLKSVSDKIYVIVDIFQTQFSTKNDFPYAWDMINMNFPAVKIESCSEIWRQTL